MEHDLNARRPIKTRETSFAQHGAKLLLKTGLSPNAVSVLSVVFAVFSCGAMWLASEVGSFSWVWWIVAALMVQLRLLCNLFDGMMAVEGGERFSKRRLV